jgi:hypothetical protein
LGATSDTFATAANGGLPPLLAIEISQNCPSEFYTINTVVNIKLATAFGYIAFMVELSC